MVQHGVGETRYRSGGYTIAPSTRQLLHDGREVGVEAKVFDLIVLLACNHRRALGKQEIVEALWGHRPVTDTALSQLIYKARRAVGDDGERQRVIRTLHGHGVQWMLPVDASPDRPDTTMPPPRAAAARLGPARRWAPALALAVLACVALVGWFASRNSPTTGLVRVAVLPIDNATDDPALDWTSRGLSALIASLLAEPGGPEVADPLEVAKASAFIPPAGMDHAEHLRLTTGATVIVDGRLQKLADQVFELTLHLDSGDGPARDLLVTGTDPGSLGASAAKSIARTVGVAMARVPASGELPRDGYLMETFARGMEPAMHQDWQAARPYFALVARSESAFLPARYRLGQAQARTDQHEAAEATLRGVIADAVGNDRTDIAAKSFIELARMATARHAYADALQLLEQAKPPAERSGDARIRAALALARVRTHARLGHAEAAEQALRDARELIDAGTLRDLEADLYNADIFVADGRGDYRALEQAARASLAANDAIGNERGSVGALFNIGYALVNQDRSIDALPLWARAWQWSRAHDDYALLARAGYYIAATLHESDLGELGDEIGATLLEQSRANADASMQRSVLQMQAGSLWQGGNEAGALRLCREASGLADERNDPQGALYTWSAEAFVALTVAPASLSRLSRRADALVSGQDVSVPFAFRRELLHALDAAARGDTAGLREAASTAASVAEPGERGELRQFMLRIALATGDELAARLALEGFDPASSNSSVELRMVEQWADAHHDDELGRQSRARRATLRHSALAMLSGTPLEIAPPSDSRQQVIDPKGE